MHTATDPPVTTVGGWHFALPMTEAHYIPPAREVRDRGGVLLADGPCGYPAILGGDDPSDLVPRCPLCVRWVAGECLTCGGRGKVPRYDQVGDVLARVVVNVSEPVCTECSGTGHHREVVA